MATDDFTCILCKEGDEPWGTTYLTDMRVELQTAWVTNSVRSERYQWKNNRADSGQGVQIDEWENIMRNGVECCREVQEEQCADDI